MTLLVILKFGFRADGDEGRNDDHSKKNRRKDEVMNDHAVYTSGGAGYASTGMIEPVDGLLNSTYSQEFAS
jgi:hypothetical protein